MRQQFLKRILFSLLIFFCWIAILVCVAAYTFLTTTWGAKIAANYLIESQVSFGRVTVGSYKGTIEKGLLLKDVIIDNIPNLKEGKLHIQELYVQVPLVHWDQLSLKISNARLNLPSADPIVFSGTIIRDQVHGNCYTRSVDARQVVSALGYQVLAKNIYGFLSHVDITVSGLISAPRLTGHFFVDQFIYQNITKVNNGFSRLDLTINALGDNPSLTGFIIMESASVVADKINIDLTTSRVDFKGNVLDPLLDIHGSTRIEDVSIDMAIKGSLLKPQLIFNSDPPLPEEEIIMMLVTGKSWSGMEDARSQAFGLRKKLTDSFNVGMAVEEMPSNPGQAQALGYSKRIEGQMNVTDQFSINVAKKFLPTDANPATVNSSHQQPGKDNQTEVFLQYKERF